MNVTRGTISKPVAAASLLVGLLAHANAFAGVSVSLLEESRRWRNDDGNEVSATWRATTNEFVYGLTEGQTIRLRFCMYPSPAVSEFFPLTMTNCLLQYSEGPRYTNNVVVPASATTEAFEMAPSAWFADQAPTTARLITGARTVFRPGLMVKYPSYKAGQITFLHTNEYTNVEFCIRPSAKAAPGRTYRFHAYTYVTRTDGVSPFAYLTLRRPGDGDGMSDAWESWYFGGTSAQRGGSADDWDDDGQTNLHEYLARTDPSDPSSKLAVASVLGGGNVLIIRWSSVTGKSYRLERSDNLLAGFAACEASGIQATPPQNACAVPVNGTSSGFFRVVLEQE